MIFGVRALRTLWERGWGPVRPEAPATLTLMSQQKTRDRKAKKKRWKHRGSANAARETGVATRDPSSRVTGPLATILGLSVVTIALGVVTLFLVNVLT